MFNPTQPLTTEKGSTGKYDKRPVNLDLTKFHFPIMAIVSISHRVSGFFLFLAIPFILYLLHRSLSSAASFEQLQESINHIWWLKFIIFLIISMTCLHWWAGLRHLLMDCGVGESLTAGRCSAWLVLILSGFCAIGVGCWLW